MASRRVNYCEVPELKQFYLTNVERTGNQLGRGAFGTVEELKYGDLLCAGKKIHDILLDHQNQGVPDLIRRFVSECRLMSELCHPNIVRFLGLCSFDEYNHPVIVMERLDKSLDDLLESQPNLPLDTKLRILVDVCKGLIYLHSKNPPVVHRDLTTKNVLICESSMQAKIADLGNARIIEPLKLSRTLSRIPGTQVYMPPEATGIKPKYDVSLDMFSFGHLALYAAIQVFPGDLLPSTYNDLVTEELKGRSELSRRTDYIDMLHESLGKEHILTIIIEQCLSNIPSKRPGAKDVLDQLEGLFKHAKDETEPIHELATAAQRSQSTRLNVIEEAVGEADEPGQVGDIDEGSGASGTVADIVVPRITEANYSTLLSTTPFQESTAEYEQVIPLREGLQVTSPASVADESSLQGLLEIYKSSGLLKKRTWKKYYFKMVDSLRCLKYYKNSKKSLGELQLSMITSVRKYSPIEDTRFYFEVQFNGKGSPWSLRACTEENRSNWLEAIEAGAHLVRTDPNEAYNFSIPDVYDHIPPSDAYNRIPQPEVYDYIDLPSVEPITHYQPIESTTRQVQAPIQLSVSKKQSPQATIYQPLDRFETKSEYQSLNRPSTVTLPSHFTSSSELPTLEQLACLDQNQVQLFMLIQMQKMLQTIQDTYHDVVIPPPAHSQGQRVVILDANTSVFPYTTAQHQSADGKLITNPKPITTTKPSSEDTASVQETDVQLETQTGTNSTINNDSSIEHSHPNEGAVSDSTSVAPKPSQRQKPIPKPRTKSRSSSVPKPLPDSQLLTPGKKNMKDILGNLLFETKTVTTDQMLVIEDDLDVEGYYPRPPWAKAETFTLQQESLASLHQEALFIPEEAIQNMQLIGGGQYGNVYKATLCRGPELKVGVEVAVKTIKKYESEKDVNDFLKEQAIMSQMIHPNVVHLYGLVEKDSPWIVLEYLPNGDLKQFLMNNPRPIEKLIKYMLDVAVGMHYISEKGLVHRDLASRNIMVGKDEICKVGDFGLLREIPKDDTIYVANSEVPFPIRWMAPESLDERKFSPASDAWSFGIVQWEMINPGELPYKEFVTNFKCSLEIVRGYKMSVPEAYHPVVQKIMKACWNYNPAKRPSFLLISSLLTKLTFGF